METIKRRLWWFRIWTCCLIPKVGVAQKLRRNVDDWSWRIQVSQSHFMRKDEAWWNVINILISSEDCARHNFPLNNQSTQQTLIKQRLQRCSQQRNPMQVTITRLIHLRIRRSISLWVHHSPRRQLHRTHKRTDSHTLRLTWNKCKCIKPLIIQRMISLFTSMF